MPLSIMLRIDSAICLIQLQNSTMWLHEPAWVMDLFRFTPEIALAVKILHDVFIYIHYVANPFTPLQKPSFDFNSS